MSIDLNAVYTITAPSGVDGYGEVAVLNNPSDTTNHVGYLYDLTFGREVRESADVNPERHGGVHGRFLSGRLPFTMEVQMARASTWALSNARYEKLAAAFNAMVSDATVVWTESGRVATYLPFRQQQSPRGPDKEGKVLLAGVSANPLILANAATGPSAPAAGLTNGGKAATFPSFSFTTPAGTGTVTLSRTSPAPTESVLLTVGGTTGLTASTLTSVDFATGTVLQGTTNKNGAVQFPASVWWMMAPGANTVTASGGAAGVTLTWRSAWLP